jgi:hypothetical protein
LLEFVRFCEDWNERTRAAASSLPDPSEFDAFADVARSGLWFIKSANDEDRHRIKDAPVFFAGDEVTWGDDQ